MLKIHRETSNARDLDHCIGQQPKKREEAKIVPKESELKVS